MASTLRLGVLRRLFTLESLNPSGFNKPMSRNIVLDWLRGLSALAVFSGHLRNALFVDYSSLVDVSLFHKIFYLITGLGHQAVMIFFVLSGYLVGGSVIRGMRRKSAFNIKEYTIARITRLWAVLIPSLFFTLIVDGILRRVSPQTLNGFYRNIWNSGPELGTYSVSLKTYIYNLLFLQTIASPVFGSNGSLWSLANEFWYYAMFPCIAVFFYKKSSFLSRLFGLILFVGIVLALPISLVKYFAIWLLGAFVAIITIYFPLNISKANCNSWFCISLFFLLSTIFVSKLAPLELHQFYYDILIAIATSMLILFSSGIATRIAPTNSQRRDLTALVLSETSYTLYLFHFPAVVLVASLYFRLQIMPSASGFAFYLLLLLIIWLFCFCMWFVFERNTHLLRALWKTRATRKNVRVIEALHPSDRQQASRTL